MKYTIIDAKKGTIFIQQHYESLAEANARLDALKKKFGNNYALEVVSVDEEGAHHKLTEEEQPS